MDQKDLKSTAELIQKDFELEAKEDILTEAALFDLLADRIAWLIEHRMEFLLSLMYRLDVAEHKVNAALSPSAPEPANVGIARLVLERQKQRVFTKKHFKQGKLEDMEGW